MVLISLIQRRLSVLFIALSLALWVAKLTLYEEPTDGCRSSGSESSPGKLRSTRNRADQPDGEEGVVENAAKWLQSKLQSLSPSHFSVQSSCTALNASVTRPSGLTSDYSPKGTSYFGTVSVLGSLHLRLAGHNQQLLQDTGQVTQWLGGVSGLIRDSDYILAGFPTLIRRTDSPKEVLNVLSDLGSGLVLSLANTELALQTSDAEIMYTMRALEGAGIGWLGTHAKKSHILAMKKERVGVLAFCGVHKECGSGNSLSPFSPVKYSAKAAKSAVKELKEHGVTVVLVLMYWGLGNSYFPDEMALTVARQLALMGVSAVIGDHSNAIQDHAYFGNTLVVFSLGKLLSSTKVADYCWNKVDRWISGDREWRYSSSKGCGIIHPNAREKLFQKEMETRIYRLHFSRNQPVTAEYTTVRLEDLDTGSGYSIRRPAIVNSSTWTTVCSDTDTHCLACQPF